MYENSTNDRHSFNTNRNVTYTSTDAACGIYGYGYKPEPVFLTGDPNKDDMLGIELETDRFTGDMTPTSLARFLHQKFGDGDWMLFGYCHIYEWEWGYVMLSDLQNLRLPFGLSIERDRHPCASTVREAVS